MLKLGILLDACGIKATSDQAQKLESFVNFWLKKHYLSKENVEKDYILKENVEKDFILKENVKRDYILKENVEKDYILKESIENIEIQKPESTEKDDIAEKENVGVKKLKLVKVIRSDVETQTDKEISEEAC